VSDVAGRIFPTPPSLRYVVLRHEGIADPHFDLMFETAQGSPLATWRSAAWPIDAETPLVRLGDHRREYLDFEGVLSGDRGHVRRVAAGFHRLDRISDEEWRFTFRDMIASSQLEFRRDAGERWVGRPRRF
jgi:hypothetical protein